MEPVSVTLMLKVLDGLSARATATAQNIANAGTPGYRPVRVSFEQALAAAAGQGSAAARAVEPTVERTVEGPLGGDLRLDLELATASSTATRYSAVIGVLDRQLQIARLAVTGGR